MAKLKESYYVRISNKFGVVSNIETANKSEAELLRKQLSDSSNKSDEHYNVVTVDNQAVQERLQTFFAKRVKQWQEEEQRKQKSKAK